MPKSKVVEFPDFYEQIASGISPQNVQLVSLRNLTTSELVERKFEAARESGANVICHF